MKYATLAPCVQTARTQKSPMNLYMVYMTYCSAIWTTVTATNEREQMMVDV